MVQDLERRLTGQTKEKKRVVTANSQLQYESKEVQRKLTKAHQVLYGTGIKVTTPQARKPAVHSRKLLKNTSS